MKIGQLAKKYNISNSAIYYYIDMGLLIPENKDKKYFFNNQDENDLRMILKLKKCQFSLDDIRRILSLTRMTNLADKGDIDDYLSYFSNQKNILIKEKNNLEIAIKEIEKEISERKSRPDNNESISGIPLDMVQFLYCPVCQRKLDLSNVYIKNNQILSGKLLCECSYEAEIINGILVTKGLYLTKYEVPDITRSFTKGLPADCINIFKKSFNWMLDKLLIENTDNKVVLEDHINTYFFLYPNISRMNKNSYYIIADKFLSMVEMYKRRIDALNLDLNILYIVNSSHEYPLKNGCVDIFLDFFSSNKFNFVEKYYYLDKTYRLFNNNSRIIGTFFYYDKSCKSIQLAIDQYEGTWDNCFNVQDFKQHFINSEKFKLIDEKEVGEVIETSNEYFTFHIKGEKMKLLSYLWQKQDKKVT